MLGSLVCWLVGAELVMPLFMRPNDPEGENTDLALARV
jgi:hypothetical protein